MALPKVKEGVQQLVTLQNPHVEPQAGWGSGGPGGARGRIVRSLPPQNLRGFRLGRLGNLRGKFWGESPPRP